MSQTGLFAVLTATGIVLPKQEVFHRFIYSTHFQRDASSQFPRISPFLYFYISMICVFSGSFQPLSGVTLHCFGILCIH